MFFFYEFYSFLLSPAACARLELKLFQLQNAPAAVVRSGGGHSCKWEFVKKWESENNRERTRSSGAGAIMNQPLWLRTWHQRMLQKIKKIEKLQMRTEHLPLINYPHSSFQSLILNFNHSTLLQSRSLAMWITTSGLVKSISFVAQI